VVCMQVCVVCSRVAIFPVYISCVPLNNLCVNMWEGVTYVIN